MWSRPGASAFAKTCRVGRVTRVTIIGLVQTLAASNSSGADRVDVGGGTPGVAELVGDAAHELAARDELVAWPVGGGVNSTRPCIFSMENHS